MRPRGSAPCLGPRVQRRLHSYRATLRTRRAADGPQGWDQARIQEVLDPGRLNNVVLETPMPVLLTYVTARVNSDGTLFFFPDVYGRDKRITEGLAAPFSFEPPTG